MLIELALAAGLVANASSPAPPPKEAVPAATPIVEQTQCESEKMPAKFKAALQALKSPDADNALEIIDGLLLQRYSDCLDLSHATKEADILRRTLANADQRAADLERDNAALKEALDKTRALATPAGTMGGLLRRVAFGPGGGAAVEKDPKTQDFLINPSIGLFLVFDILPKK